MKKTSLTPLDIWGAAQAAGELWISVPLVIAMRTQQWWLAPLDKRQHTENNRMVSEKVAAMTEIGFVWQNAAAAWWLGAFDPWRTSRQLLDPLRRRATSNVRRLQRAKRRVR